MPFSLQITTPHGATWADAKWYIKKCIIEQRTKTGMIIMEIYKDATAASNDKQAYETFLSFADDTPIVDDATGATIRASWASIAWESRANVETYLKTLKVFFQGDVYDLTLAT